MLIIDKKTIMSSVVTEINDGQYAEIVLLGKGPTFDKYHAYTPTLGKKPFLIGVNDAVNVVICDMLVANDIETFDRLDCDMASKLKFILVPYHPHKQEKPLKNITYANIIKKKSLNLFNGKIIPFNLATYRKQYLDYITLDSAISSANTAIDFISHYLSFINTINIFGIGILGHQKYSKIFLPTGGVNNYNDKKINMIKNHIIKNLSNKIWTLN